MDSVRMVSMERRSMSVTCGSSPSVVASSGFAETLLPAGRTAAVAACHHGSVAVLIASNLRKELSGDPLFERVSFKVERGDRVALAGPNGAGKTTLLRILVGETSHEAGELAWEKGARVALHDQRPPVDRALSLREYVLTGAADLVATERELGELEQAMAAGVHDTATLDAYGKAQARL